MTTTFVKKNPSTQLIPPKFSDLFFLVLFLIRVYWHPKSRQGQALVALPAMAAQKVVFGLIVQMLQMCQDYRCDVLFLLTAY